MTPKSGLSAPSTRETHERRLLVGVGVAVAFVIVTSSIYALYQFALANSGLVMEFGRVVLMAALMLATLYALGGATLLAAERFR